MEYVITKVPKNFMQLWGVRIKVEDCRTGAKEVLRGKVAGITEDEVLIQLKEEVTRWLPLKDDNVRYFLLK